MHTLGIFVHIFDHLCALPTIKMQKLNENITNSLVISKTFCSFAF